MGFVLFTDNSKTIFAREYYEHWYWFISALFLLLGDNMSTDDIAHAEFLLKMFVAGVERLHSIQDCTYNLHQMLHLPLAVQRWGSIIHHPRFYLKVTMVIS